MTNVVIPLLCLQEFALKCVVWSAAAAAATKLRFSRSPTL